MPEEIQDVVKRISEGCYNSTDLQAIEEAVKAEQITVVSGDQAVGIGGSAENATIVTGTNNITGNHFAIHIHGIQVAEILEIIQSNRSQAVQEELLQSLGVEKQDIAVSYITLNQLEELSKAGQLSEPQDEELLTLKQRIKFLDQNLKEGSAFS